jgi:uncharacterized membrane protein YhaH (DUF805 family)
MNTTANPYAPPQAAVADIDDARGGTAPVRNWSAQGRIGRLRYIAHLTGAYLVMILFMFLVGFTMAFLKAETAATVLIWGGAGVYLWFFVLKTIQRSHDMGWSGWMSLLSIIPVVNLIWWFKGGSAGANRFGLPPPPNTTGVRILGLLLPVIMILGILAAIALPAYQQYTIRAKAAQMK